MRFLTKDELKIITGYSRSEKIKSWLNSYSIKFAENKNGYPVVLEDEYRRVMLGGNTFPEAAPNFDKMNNWV